jgi:hypothetical protein
MIKKLFFTTALVVPSLAYAGNPSADLAVQIVPAVAPPAPAAAAGFMTLARNWDFSQPKYAVQSNWLDCNGTRSDVEWHGGAPGQALTEPCDIHQGLDDEGNTVMVFNYPSSYSFKGPCNACNFVTMQSANFSPAQQTAFPNGSYIEITVKESKSLYNNGQNNSSGPDGLYTATTDMTDSAMLLRPQWLEQDPGELWLGAGGFANGNLMMYPAQDPGQIWFSYNSQNNLPSGWSVTTYHTYGVLQTSDGSTEVYACLYVDNNLQQSCRPMHVNTHNPLVFKYPQRLIVWAGGDGVAVDKKMYVKSIRVWSCPTWENQMTDHSKAYCTGSGVFKNGSLTYWH